MNALSANELSLLPDKIQKYFPQDVPFVRLGTHGDGTCFFHSVCAAHNEKGYLTARPEEQKRIGRQYRCNFSKHITDKKWAEVLRHKGVNRKMSAEQARRNFCNSRAWANQEMITFVSRVLGINFLFIDTESCKLYCGVHGEPDEPMIVVLWIQHSHFEPVGACRQVAKDNTAVQFVFHPVRDANVIDHIINKYSGQCDI
jgi:hypothetical protein